MITLSPAMQAALDSPVRRPDYRIYAYDASVDKYTAIITGTATQEPLDLTEYCTDINWKPAQLSFNLVDENGDFHPDYGQYRAYIKDGAIIRLLEGDERVPMSQWVYTFTGAIKGQSGWTKGTRPSTLVAKVSAYNRDNCQAYKRRQITTQEYTAGTDLGIVCQDLGVKYMELSAAEVLIASNLGRTLMHRVNQLVQVAPWDGLSSVLEVVSQVPRFNGEGKLTTYEKNLVRSPDIVLNNSVRIYLVEAPQRTGDVINRVEVIFLDSTLEEVDGVAQCLGTASITTGFFTSKEELTCFWSEDRKQRAKGTWMKTIKSINANLIPVGTESYQQDNDYSGTITITIGFWIPLLAIQSLAGYAAAAFIPDDVVVALPAPTGVTISIGRALQAAMLCEILLVMMCLGSAQYEIWGTPYDMVYKEKRSVAVQDGLAYYEENPKEIKNDFIGSHDQADSVALTELIFEKSSGEPRRVIMDDYLQLEIGDILQIPDGRRFFVQDLSKSIKRGELPTLQVDGFHVLKV